MPMVPMNIDSSTVAVTSTITAVITFFFATTVGQIKPATALALAVIVGLILYAIGVIPIGLLFIVGISMIVAIFKTTTSASTSSEPNSEKERRRALGYVESQQRPNTNSPPLNQGPISGTQSLVANKLEQIAESGDTQASVTLGEMSFSGNEVPQDHVQAAQWYRKAADQGSVEAQNNLGILYDIGQGVRQDHVKAAQWFRKAADQGYADAQSNLGLLYSEGQGVPQDYVQAARWFRKAADQGVADAQYNLGMLYREGQGVPQDIIEAWKWLHLAGASSSSGALQNLELIEKMLTPDQIAEAKQRASSGIGMKDNLRENEMWTQTILHLVHEPMVAFKVGRYPVGKIINQLPVNERRKIKEGIDAVTELGFFVMDGSDICLRKV